MFFNSTDQDPHFSLGFYPKNDRDRYIINNDRIRSICAALEYEAEEKKIKDSSQELKELIRLCKKCVKWYRKKSKSLNKTTYEKIFSSFEHWSFSAREKITILWEEHKGAMDVLTRNLITYSNLDIGKFVKYRNGITHGAEAQVTEEIAITAIALRGLVYCCLLSRIGVSEDKIIQMCEYKINE